MSALDLTAFSPPLSFELPATAVTLEGFRAWAVSSGFPDQGRITFINGKLYVDMSPEGYESHLRIKHEITFVIESLVRQQQLGEVYMDGAWFTHPDAGVSNEPDVMFATWDTLRSGRFRPAADSGHRYTEMVGTPDWVCEVVSDSSERKDTTLLRRAYFEAGIAEYWVVDARGDAVLFTLLEAGDSGYREVAADGEGFRASKVFAQAFQLRRDEDELGRWCYTLSHR